MENSLVFIRRQRNLPSIKSLQPGLCNYPSQVVNIDHNGYIFVCLCEAWLPWSIGHVMDFASIHDIQNAKMTKDIIRSQELGHYEYCDTKHCNVSNQFERKLYETQIYLGIDDSCQLTCPSCRNEMIFEKDYHHKINWVQRIIKWLNHENLGPTNILIGAHGDPFASRLYRETMEAIGKLDTIIKFQLRTNGLLLTRYLEELDILSRLSLLEISIDAATEHTYQLVRQPARWANLIENLEFLQTIRQVADFQVQANFVVQKNNYKEMPNFVDLCNNYNMRPNFTLLQDWNTFSYKNNAVHQSTHADHLEFLSVIANDKIKPYIGNKFDNWTKS